LSSKLVFETCAPRPDVLLGQTRDDHFMADLAKVVNRTALADYGDPATFFSRTHPTRGLRELLKAVCKRLSPQGGEVASIIRLHTQYGGGKTHGLIALTHAVRGMQRVESPEEFVDPALLPKEGNVRVAALDGENADPANGLTLETDLRAYSIWGEMAYQLAGRDGYERVRESDRNHIAPGAETIRELFGGEPTLIMLDEISVYLRKVERAHPGAAAQFTAFIHALIKAVASSPQAALVVTLAIGKDHQTPDAYQGEQTRALEAFEEAEKVVSRGATQLNPTEEDETVDVLRRRLFEQVDMSGVNDLVQEFAALWDKNRELLPEGITSVGLRELFRKSYPFHPELLTLLTEKTATLSTFQRTRGMLRLLARTVHSLWEQQPADALVIHPHHIALGSSAIREEILVRLEQQDYTPPLKADVEAVTSDEDRALAQDLDARHYPSQAPLTTYIARTVFLHTLAYHNDLKGVQPDRLRYSVCSPAIEPAFVEQARERFVKESLYLDDRPGAPMRFMVEANLEQMIRRQMKEIEAGEVRADLNVRIKHLFGMSNGPFNLCPFPAGAYEVPDEANDERPWLVVLGYEEYALGSDPSTVPPIVEEVFQFKGHDQKFRIFRNNLVFVVADARQVENMRTNVRRALALKEMQKPEIKSGLADYQQKRLESQSHESAMKVAEAILHCYRHLFYPSSIPMQGSKQPLAHSVIEFAQASASPGNGQLHIDRILRQQTKILGVGDPPPAPAFVRDKTALKTKGEISTLELRNEFRRAPNLQMLKGDEILVNCIRQGIETEVFIYREGDQVWGKGDPTPTIQISENAYVHTLLDAKAKRLWPRAEPLELQFETKPTVVKAGEPATLGLTISGGTPPYQIASEIKEFAASKTEQTTFYAQVTPPASTSYAVEVVDARKKRRSATVEVRVAVDGETLPPPPPVPPPPPPEPPKPRSFSCEGPLGQALTDLWEQVRKAGVQRIGTLLIKFYSQSDAWKVHQAILALRNVEVSCQIAAEFESEDSDELTVAFRGKPEKANSLRGFLETQARSCEESKIESAYTLRFPDGLQTDEATTEKLRKDLICYGAGAAWVEAHAAPGGEA